MNSFFHEVCSGLLFNPIFPKKKQTHFAALGPMLDLSTNHTFLLLVSVNLTKLRLWMHMLERRSEKFY